MDKEQLLEIIASDDLGLLNVKPREANGITADARLIESFKEINDFISKNGKEPESGKSPQEHKLYARLESLRENPEKMESLSSLDEHNLFNITKKEILSIEDILADDDLGLFDSDKSDIFTLKHVPLQKRAQADSVARRTQCKNFSEYEDKFRLVHNELREGDRKTRNFNDKGENLKEGNFYLLNGMILYLESVDISSTEKTVNGKRFRKDGRTRCIFENGTESNMLYRSLAKVLYQNGRIITETNKNVSEGVYENALGITKDDQQSGFIYVLRSLSDNPEIKSIPYLYKIGFSNTSVEERIKNAKNEITYLMADVQIVTTFKCYNMNTKKLEKILHQFFGTACLNVDIFDNKKQRHTPREWFVAPLDIIRSVINLVITREIVYFKYDADIEQIVKGDNR